MRVPGGEGFKDEIAFQRGATVKVEVDVGHAEYSQRIARSTAEHLQRRGFKIGQGGWTLRADHSVGERAMSFDRPSGEKFKASFAALKVVWTLLAPDGATAWSVDDGGRFDPRTTKYVKVGSRRFEVIVAATDHVLGRTAQIDAMVRGAAATDPQIAEMQREHDRRTRRDVRRLVALLAEVGPLRMSEDAAVRRASIEQFSKTDADSFERWEEWLGSLADILAPLLTETPPRLGSHRPFDLVDQGKLAWQARSWDVRATADITRLFASSISDLLDDYFESDAMKGVLSVSGVIGTWAGPRSAGTAYVMESFPGAPSPRSLTMTARVGCPSPMRCCEEA